MKCRPIKDIPLMCTKSVDIKSIRRVVDNPRFQLLRYRLQLGEAQIAFPDAVHTRLSHSLGTYKVTQRRMNRWQKWHKAIS